VGKKIQNKFFVFFFFVFWKSEGKAAHFGQLNSFFDNSAVLRTGIFLIFIISLNLVSLLSQVTLACLNETLNSLGETKLYCSF